MILGLHCFVDFTQSSKKDLFRTRVEEGASILDEPSIQADLFRTRVEDGVVNCDAKWGRSKCNEICSASMWKIGLCRRIDGSACHLFRIHVEDRPLP